MSESTQDLRLVPLRWVGRTPDAVDLAEIAGLYRAYETARTGGGDTTAAEMASWLATSTIDHGATALFRDDADRAVAFVCLAVEQHGKDVYVDVAVRPGEDERAAFDVALGHAVRECARIVAERGETGWTMRTTTWLGDDVGEQAHSEHGLERVRRFYRMHIDSDSPAIPSTAPDLPLGVEVVVRDDEATRHAIYDLDMEAFLDHWNFTPMPYEEWWDHFSAGDTRDADGWWLMQVDGVPAAFCLLDESRVEDDLGYVCVLGVKREFRGRGLATLLLQRAFVRYRDMGRIGTQLGVDAESLTNAVALYERVGMRQLRVMQGWALPLS